MSGTAARSPATICRLWRARSTMKLRGRRVGTGPAMTRPNPLWRVCARADGTVSAPPVADRVCPEAVAEQVEGQHGVADRDSREGGDQRGGFHVVARGTEIGAPVRRWRRRAQAEKRQRGDDQNDVAQANRGIDDQRRDDVGQDLPERNAEAAVADGARRLDIFLLFLRKHRAARQARHLRGEGKAQREDQDHIVVDALELPFPGQGHDQQIEQQAWERQQSVDDPHRHRIDLAAEIAGEHAVRDSDRQAEGDRQQRDGDQPATAPQ